MSGGWVYILASRYRGTLYIGVTADIARRAAQHREGTGSKFASKYGVDRLVLMELYESIEEAIVREKRLKKWNRDWKIRLIEESNPDWVDLWDTINA
jgi:putative endonuclease